MSNYDSFDRKNTDKTLISSPQTNTVKEMKIKHRTVVNPNMNQVDVKKSIKIENLRSDVIDEEKGSVTSQNLVEASHVENKDKFINNLY